MVKVFLDQISSFAHVPEEECSKNEPWRNTLVQSVSLPDFEHIDVATDLLSKPKNKNTTATTKNGSLWYPDGSVGLELREQISEQVRLSINNANVDHNDVRVRDKKHTKRKKKLKLKGIQ